MIIGATMVKLANMNRMKRMDDIVIKRWFWNDKEVTKEEHDMLVAAWKRTTEVSEESEDKPKRKKK